MATLIIRLRTRGGTKRLLFGRTAAETTWKDLQLQIQDVLDVPVQEQLISQTPLHNPRYIEVEGDATLASLGIKHGDMLHLKEEIPEQTEPPVFLRQEQQKLRELQKRCNHGPRGRCLNCDNVKAEVLSGRKDESEQLKHCSHGPNAVCILCSSYIAEKNRESKGLGDGQAEAPAAWLCNHPDSTFCPNCLPPEEKDDNFRPIAKKTCACDHARGERCTECVDLDKEQDTIKHDLLPWNKYVESFTRTCVQQHKEGEFCIRCAPPEMPSYVGRPDCDSGHKPWPSGVCLKCAPSNAVIRAQKYRHVDTVSMPAPVVQSFYVKWRRLDPSAKTQRAGILFGRYETEPGIEGGVRAVVHACYEPPQEFVRNGVRFLRDPQEKIVEQTAQRLGLEPVGWMLTTVPRGGDKYHGKVFLSGNEVRAAARLQARYSQPGTLRSRFVTVVVEHGDVVTPAAYQVSDQCVALQRDGCFANAEDPLMIGTHKPQPGELVPKLVYRDEVIENGSDILTDDFIVKVILSAQVLDAAENNVLVCKHFDFPSESLHLGREEGLRQLKTILAKYDSEDWTGKLSDFLLLCFLPQILPDELVAALCEAYRKGERPTRQILSDLDAAMIPFAY